MLIDYNCIIKYGIHISSLCMIAYSFHGLQKIPLLNLFHVPEFNIRQTLKSQSAEVEREAGRHKLLS
jgi:hypothetical protein